MKAPLIEIGEDFLIGREIAGFWQDLPIGQHQLIEKFVLFNQKLNQPVGIELIIQLNCNFTELQTAFKILNNMEGGPSAIPDLWAHSSKGAGSSASCQAHSSQGAGTDEAIMVTKHVRLMGKFPLIDLNPDSWQNFKMDPEKKASIIAWLNDSPLTPDIPVENEKVSRVHRMLLQYKNNEGIPRIEDM